MLCEAAIDHKVSPCLTVKLSSPKAGAVDSLYHLLQDSRLNHRCQTTAGVLAPECGEILSRFFQEKRRLGKK